jgi:hypothetical protein
MPTFYFACPLCKTVVRKLLDREPKDPRCQVPFPDGPCGTKLKRTPKPPKAQMKEVVDTGLANMPRRIERFVDIEQVNHERAHQDYSKPEWQKSGVVGKE